AQLWAQREGERTFRGHNTRGAEVLMGPVELENAFTPGELMQLALAGCAAMSSDVPIARRLGEDYPATIVASAQKHETENRYAIMRDTLILDLSGLDEVEKEKLADIIARAHAKHCTVGNTISASAEIEHSILDA
ncbi:MAG: OsmC family protein, partial [Propionibacteriaceae bacterium]|nr:OsmC family protein [Propionibacteriaceae bacterium]